MAGGPTKSQHAFLPHTSTTWYTILHFTGEKYWAVKNMYQIHSNYTRFRAVNVAKRSNMKWQEGRLNAIAALGSSGILAITRAGAPLPFVSFTGITITSKPLGGSFCERKCCVNIICRTEDYMHYYTMLTDCSSSDYSVCITILGLWPDICSFTILPKDNQTDDQL